MDDAPANRLRVLQSFRPNASTNPYLLQLLRGLEDYANVEPFGWRTALLGRYDVFHVHWPEVLITGGTRVRTVVRSLLFVVVLAVARARRRAIVRTVHNVEPHDGIDPIRRRILALCDRWTTGWITLTATVTPPEPFAVIPHGHYRDWYRVGAEVDAVPGRILLFGNIRRYKGVSELLAALSACTTSPCALRIVGRPLDDDSTSAIEGAIAADGRVSARLEYLDDADLAEEIRRATLVVLPYRSMVNSGAALLALSLDRPVLAPTVPSTVELQGEVGSRWLMTYDPPLTAAALESSLERAATSGEVGRPDLSARDWDDAVRAHIALYHRAVARARH